MPPSLPHPAQEQLTHPHHGAPTPLPACQDAQGRRRMPAVPAHGTALFTLMAATVVCGACLRGCCLTNRALLAQACPGGRLESECP